MALAARTVGANIGARINGGIVNAVSNASSIGANVFGVFMKCPGKYASTPLLPENAINFKNACGTEGYSSKSIVSYCSFVVNLAEADCHRIRKSYECYREDMARSSMCGIDKLVVYLKPYYGSTQAEAAARVANQISQAIEDSSTGSVVTLLRNSSNPASLGRKLEDIAAIISHVREKSRIGVCLDVSEFFAAGNDLRTPSDLSHSLDMFHSIIDLKYLRALALSDCIGTLGSETAKRTNIGTGFLGLRAFHAIMNEKRLWGLPLLLETPTDCPARAPNTSGKKKKEGPKTKKNPKIWAREIKLLESLVGVDPDGDEFGRLEKNIPMYLANEKQIFLVDTPEKQKQ